jgi:hypothetical protein
MAYPRRILEAYLSTWELEESGQLGDAPLNLVGELIYPRPMVDRREHTLTLPHVIGEPVDRNDQPFHQRILFKEVVEGPFSLGFTLLRQSDEGALSRLVQSVLQSSEGSGESEIRSSAVLPPMAQVVTSAVDLGLESRLKKELGDVVAGQADGRTSEDEITVFDSGGTAIETVAAAHMLYERAREAGLGTTIDVAPASEAMELE